MEILLEFVCSFLNQIANPFSESGDSKGSDICSILDGRLYSTLDALCGLAINESAFDRGLVTSSSA